MGTYLTKPITEKFSSDEANEFIDVGASSMQGWRISQEDAHNCILDFDDKTSFFAVYDGHGGAEVATYCAERFPEFLKNLNAYREGDYEQALKDAFLGFDETLLQEDVIEILKRLAGERNPEVLKIYKAVILQGMLNKKKDEAVASSSGTSKPLRSKKDRRNMMERDLPSCSSDTTQNIINEPTETDDIVVSSSNVENENSTKNITSITTTSTEGICKSTILKENRGRLKCVSSDRCEDSGCTAVIALLQGRDLYVANAGDSRCVLCRGGRFIEMSLDHKPEDDTEKERIYKAGGKVTMDGRVNGGLNLSRAIGDHAYKMNKDLPPEEQMISALPDIKKIAITPQDEFMILACDGIWNYMSSEEVIEFVKTRLDEGRDSISEICEELFDNCLAPHTIGGGTGRDNMTAVIVRFKQPKILELPTNLSIKNKVGSPKKRRASLPTSLNKNGGNTNPHKRVKSEKDHTKNDSLP